MNVLNKPGHRPGNPLFSSGPCTKRPGWTPAVLNDALVGRSHRSAPGKAKLLEAIEKTKTVLNIPQGYRVGIVPASDTGAMEMALWSMLGARGVDMLAWESFGEGWVSDVVNQLKLPEVRLLRADYGDLPALDAVDFNNDVVFTWNGTTSGVRVPNADWIDPARKGLTICDATSAAFAQNLEWSKLDVVTFSWQKVLGGEAAHGMLVLSPRAVERLESYTPSWPIPKIFRLTKSGKLIEGIFTGATINTPSMLAVEDYLDALTWAESVGGSEGLQKRANDNLAIIEQFVVQSNWLGFLPKDPATRSNTSVCLKVVHPQIVALDQDRQASVARSLAKRLADENVALDIGSYRDAPAGLRIWTGGTVEKSDLIALMPWLDWAFSQELATIQN